MVYIHTPFRQLVISGWILLGDLFLSVTGDVNPPSVGLRHKRVVQCSSFDSRYKRNWHYQTWNRFTLEVELALPNVESIHIRSGIGTTKRGIDSHYKRNWHYQMWNWFTLQAELALPICGIGSGWLPVPLSVWWGGGCSIIIIRKMMWSLLWWRRRTRIRLNFFLLFLTTGQILEWSGCTTFFLRLYWPRDILLLLWCVNPNKAKWNMTESCTKGYWVWAWVVNYYLFTTTRLSLTWSNEPTVPNGGGGRGWKVVSNQPQKVFRKISTCNNCRRSPFMGAYGLDV